MRTLIHAEERQLLLDAGWEEHEINKLLRVVRIYPGEEGENLDEEEDADKDKAENFVRCLRQIVRLERTGAIKRTATRSRYFREYEILDFSAIPDWMQNRLRTSVRHTAKQARNHLQAHEAKPTLEGYMKESMALLGEE